MLQQSRLTWWLVGVVLVGAAFAVYAAVDSAEASDQRSVVTSDIRAIVADSVGAPGSPIAPGAENSISHLYTPADPSLPGFFTVPTKDGERCIVTSDAVFGSCLQRDLPGTVTVRDDSTGDGVPPFVYGLVRPNVVAVSVSVKEVAEPPTTLKDGFYLLKLQSADSRVDDVDRVSFTLKNGRTIVRDVTA